MGHALYTEPLASIEMKIGNKNHIAFEIKDENLSEDLWDLNFYLGGKLISNEAVYIPTYLSILGKFSNQLLRKQFENLECESLSSNQRFNKLMKERDYNENQFFKHLLQIDETIDQYMIFVFQIGSETTFIWNCWDKHNCNSEHELKQIYSVKFLTEELLSTINQLIEKINKHLANKS